MPLGRLPWLLSLPVMGAGCLAAHSAAYRVADSTTPAGTHSYLGAAPLLLAIGMAVAVVAALHAATAGGDRGGASVRLFALLPPLAFALQEHLERALQGGDALGTALEPAFLLGLALQLPFALCSLILARSLLRAARAALRPAQTQAARRRAAVVQPPSLVDLPRHPALSFPQAGRAPPLPAGG
jgi:hypothetical protein